jgi:hypothetical protein
LYRKAFVEYWKLSNSQSAVESTSSSMKKLLSCEKFQVLYWALQEILATMLTVETERADHMEVVSVVSVVAVKRPEAQEHSHVKPPLDSDQGPGVVLGVMVMKPVAYPSNSILVYDLRDPELPLAWSC